MKKTLLILSLIATIAITFFACSEREHTNPLDSEYWRKTSIIPTEVTVEFTNPYNFCLIWEDNCDGEDGYKIDKKIGLNEWIIGYASVEKNSTIWSDIDIQTDVYLNYRLYAYKGDFATKEVEVYCEEGIYIHIESPSTASLILDENFTNFRVSFNDNCEGEDGYIVERKIADGEWNYIGQVDYNIDYVGDYNPLSFFDCDIVFNLPVKYRVYAYIGSLKSSTVETNSINVNYPAPFLGPQDEYYGDNFSFYWDWDGNYYFFPIDGFEIQRKVDSGEWYLYKNILSNISNFTDSGLEQGKFYYYRIRAYYKTCYSSYSNEIGYYYEFDPPPPKN